MANFEVFLLMFCTLIVVLQIIVLLKKHSSIEDVNTLEQTINNENRQMRQELNQMMQTNIAGLGNMLAQNQSVAADVQKQSIANFENSFKEKQEMLTESLRTQLSFVNETLRSLQESNEQKLDLVRHTLSDSISRMQDSNEKRLGEIQKTVDEKLQKTLEDKMTSSFRMVSEQLEQVYKSMGEMQSIAQGVGDLKKVLSNVKTRGILGEVQLGVILSDILTHEQYKENIATIPNSNDRVEFAIKLPGKGMNEFVYLPIDSKFPGDSYMALQSAYESMDKKKIEDAGKQLEFFIKQSARTIKEKYIYPPYTTNFGIMFLPFEGLYAEVVNRGLFEAIQREYSVTIVGPSTMSAILNALQMGFRTLQIEKRSNEVWNILSAVKTEFNKFEEAFAGAQKRLQQIDKDLNDLVGTRTRAIQRKLRDVQTIDGEDASNLLEN